MRLLALFISGAHHHSARAHVHALTQLLTVGMGSDGMLSALGLLWSDSAHVLQCIVACRFATHMHVLILAKTTCKDLARGFLHNYEQALAASQR